MKCLLVSDLHYTLKQFDWLDRVAGDFDIVVIAGDHLDISSMVALDAQVVVILTYLRRLRGKTTLLVSSGNHDLNARDAADEKVARWMSRVRQLGVVSDGDSLEVGGTLFTVCPWWDGPRSRQAVGEQLARDASRRGKRWVWIYHAPPDASPVSWAGQKHFGDTELVRVDTPIPARTWCSPATSISRPSAPGGSWVDRIGETWVFNAGRQIGPVPTHVILDTDAHRARCGSRSPETRSCRSISR